MMKRTFVLSLHVVAPLLFSLLYIVYYKIRLPNQDVNFIALFYYEALMIAYPLMISLVCSLVTSNLMQANRGQAMLGATSRIKFFITQLFTLYVLGILAMALGSIMLYISFDIPLQQQRMYFLYTVIFITFLYVLYYTVSLAFGTGLTIVVGGTGFLVTALMFTGLSEGIWYYIPFAWGPRFFQEDDTSLISMITLCATVVWYALSLLWLQRFEGREMDG